MDGDLTTAAVVPAGARAVARIEQRAPGVLSGMDAAREVFAQTGPELRFDALADEGAWREPGDVAVIEGDAAAILAGERVALNLLGRLSGVATLTASYVRAVDGTGARILDTRKTTPGPAGAGEAGRGPRRRGLAPRGPLRRDPREGEPRPARGRGGGGRAPGGGQVGGRARPSWSWRWRASRSSTTCWRRASTGCCSTTWTPPMRGAVELRGGPGRRSEASGGITLETIRAVAETGVDYISVGALTHSAPALDLSACCSSLSTRGRASGARAPDPVVRWLVCGIREPRVAPRTPWCAGWFVRGARAPHPAADDCSLLGAARNRRSRPCARPCPPCPPSSGGSAARTSRSRERKR